MTIKEIAEKKGISLQAAYKRIKKAGIDLNSLKDKATGQLTADGEKRLLQMFGLWREPTQQEIEMLFDVSSLYDDDKPREGKVQPKVEYQIEKFKSQIESLEARITELEKERDFLRGALERSQAALDRAQQLQAMATAKIPNPEPVHALVGEVEEAEDDEDPGKGWFGLSKKKKKKDKKKKKK